MRYSQIRDMDVVNGRGVAVSLFVQGCSNHCKGCFNQSTWDFNGGKEWTKEVQDKFIKLCQKDYVDCVSILGGEPLDQPLMDADFVGGKNLELIKREYGLLNLLMRIKVLTNKPIYLWTGYTLEELKEKKPLAFESLLDTVSFLIDGKYDESKRNLNLKLRGSSNQRIWDLRSGTPIDITKTIDNE